MGLLDGNLDPQAMATMQLAAGLLSPGSFGQGLSNGLRNYQGSMAASQDQQIQAQAMKLKEAQAAEAQRAAQRQQAMQGLAPQFAGPAGFDFGGYANAVAQYDPQAALSLKAALTKDDTPIKLGAGEKLLAKGTYAELANNPKDEKDDPLTNLIAKRDALPVGDPRRKLYDLAISKATTHQPGTSVTVGLQSPVPIDLGGQGTGYVQPANKPGAAPQLMINPATNKPFLKPVDPNSPNKVGDAKESLALIDQSEKLIDKATGSYLGVGRDVALGAFGQSTPQADAAAQLKVLGGSLTSKVPKMSGPTSDKDMATYKEMAGRIGDPTVPSSQKKAALKTMREINQRYAGQTPGAPAPADVRSQADAILKGN